MPSIDQLSKPVRRLLKGLALCCTLPPLELLPEAPDLFRCYRALRRCPNLERRPGGWLYQGKFYPDYLTVGGASHAIFAKAMTFCTGNGVDLGAGLWPLPGSAAVDIWRGPGAGRSLLEFAPGTLDYVFSSHCLEHIEDWRDVLSESHARLRAGGRIFLYLPHPACAIWHPGSPFVGDGHRWIPTPEIIKDALRSLGCEIIDSEDGPDAMQSFYVVGLKTEDRG